MTMRRTHHTPVTDPVTPAAVLLPEAVGYAESAPARSGTSGRLAPIPATYRAAQVILWGPAGAWAHDTFSELNAQYFANAIPHAGIAWGLTPHGHLLGYTHRIDGRITLHSALLDPHSNAWGMWSRLGERCARDVLLHEMIHAFLLSRDECPDHNARPWCREVERLALALGLGVVHAAPVKARRINGRVVKRPLDGHLTQKALGAFPHSLRPVGYYESANNRMRIRL